MSQESNTIITTFNVDWLQPAQKDAFAAMSIPMYQNTTGINHVNHVSIFAFTNTPVSIAIGDEAEEFADAMGDESHETDVEDQSTEDGVEEMDESKEENVVENKSKENKKNTLDVNNEMKDNESDKTKDVNNESDIETDSEYDLEKIYEKEIKEQSVVIVDGAMVLKAGWDSDDEVDVKEENEVDDKGKIDAGTEMLDNNGGKLDISE